MGKKTIHLSSQDKESFYRHLGYSNGPVVSPILNGKILQPEQVVPIKTNIAYIKT